MQVFNRTYLRSPGSTEETFATSTYPYNHDELEMSYVT
jgi:hypothetical protein